MRDDLFDQLRALEELDVETPLERAADRDRRPGVDCQARRSSSKETTITFPGPRIAAELEFVAAADGPFRLADLPGRLDDAGRLVLGRRLVREGFLRARADGEAARALQSRLALQVRKVRSPSSRLDVGPYAARPAAAKDAPGVAVALDRSRGQCDIVDAGQPGLPADRLLRRLHRERVAGAAAIVLEGDAAAKVVVQDPAHGFPVDAPVVEALRQADEVAGEAIAADVGHLPGPVGVELVPERLVERAAVARAAGVVLAVRADEEERVSTRQLAEKSPVGRRRADLVGSNSERVSASSLGPRAEEANATNSGGAAIGPADEEEPAVPDRGNLVAEVLLDLVGEPAAGQRVPRPETSVLDQEPVVDPAGGRAQRLVVLA